MKATVLRFIVIPVLAALFLTAGSAAAQPAYEPFNYPPGSAINGQNGGTGWGAPWTGFGNNVVAPGLVYPGLVTSGNALWWTPGSASSRPLASPIAGAPGISMVLRALFRSDVNGTLASQATLGNSSGGTFIIGDLPMPDAAAGNWGLQNAAGRFYSNVPVAANATVYLVAQIDFDVSGANDRMRLWVNPPTGAGNAYFTVAPQVDVTNASVGQFSGVFWQTQQQQRVDEIRVDSSKKSCALPPNTTMVGWYPFDEPAGPVALNLATANDGLHVNGPTPIQGIVAGALRFDGVNDYVESPSSIATNFGPAAGPVNCGGTYSTCQGDLSIDTWIRVDPASSNPVIVDKRAGSPPAIKGYSLFLFGGSFGIQLADGAGTGFSNFVGPLPPTALSDGRWHHIAVTVKRAPPAGATLIRFYHNGVLIGTTTTTPAAGRKGSLVNNSSLRIGTRTAASPLTGWFKGDLDELEIFNRVLTPQEVKRIFDAGPFGKCK